MAVDQSAGEPADELADKPADGLADITDNEAPIEEELRLAGEAVAGEGRALRAGMSAARGDRGSSCDGSRVIEAEGSGVVVVVAVKAEEWSEVEVVVAEVEGEVDVEEVDDRSKVDITRAVEGPEKSTG